MKFVPKNIRKHQEGGAMAPAEEPAEATAPAQGGQDPLTMLAEGAMQALQNQDCNLAMQVCQALVQLVQQMANGTPQEASQGEPVFKKGGILLRRIKK